MKAVTPAAVPGLQKERKEQLCLSSCKVREPVERGAANGGLFLLGS